MPLSPGVHLGPYEVTAQIGAGGMGEVYRAHDSKLGRDVALKVLPDAFVDDPERLARFRREAQVLASLNHPNIAAIYGLEESGHTHALVMELAEGPTLADLIAQANGEPEGESVRSSLRDGASAARRGGGAPRGLNLDEALEIARQIADALASAHDQGIVHRDLKPANVKVRGDGTVKVLDFGLARAMDPAAAPSGSAPASLSMSPTLTSPMTQMGIVLGTAAYMSPEQARGRVVDRRADIWAFGVTLYEMVTGRRLFEGEDLTETLAGVVMKPADLADVPHRLRRLIGKCLEKDPRKRLQAIGDWELLVDDGTMPAAPGASAAAPRRWPWLVGASVLTALVLVPLTALLRPSLPTAPIIEFALDERDLPNGATYSLSPDGLKIVMSGRAQEPLRLRPLDDRQGRSIAGTEGARYPFWSPDSRFIGFFVDGRLKKVPVDGGPAQTLAAAESGRGGTWNADGVILFAPGPFEQIMRVAEGGGEATPVTASEESDGRPARRFPFFLPDGRHFLYSDSAAEPDKVGVYVGSIDGDPVVHLLRDDTNAVYSPAPEGGVGHLLFVREATLMAQPFDPDRLELTGDATPVAESIGQAGNRGAYGVSVSAGGALLYVHGTSAATLGQPAWVDRAGNVQRTIGRPVASPSLSLSPDDARAALSIAGADGAPDIWVLDLARENLVRLTSDPGGDLNPRWSPDGSQIAFSGERSGPARPIIIDSSGVGTERRLLESQAGVIGNQLSVQDWSPDGHELLVIQQRPRTESDVLILSLDDQAAPVEFLATEFNEGGARFSPDGRWVAYASDEDGEPAVYVRPYPLANTKTRISREGGTAPRWSRDGSTLFYWSNGEERTLTAVPLTFGDGVTPGTPEALFTRTNPSTAYDVSRDGRFVMLLRTDTGDQGDDEADANADGGRQFVFVSNWRR